MFTAEQTAFSKQLIEYALKDERGPKRWHVTRLNMYTNLSDKLKVHDASSKKVLCISKSLPLAKVLGLNAAAPTITRYPDVNIFKMPYADGEFDFVVSDMVLEHVEGNPFDAAKESVRVCKPGGFIVHTTVFVYRMHQLPLDFWRFAPRALEMIMQSAGAEVVEVGRWGNRGAWTLIALGYHKHPIPEVPGNPIYDLAMRDEKKWPLTTWVVAKKPG